MRNKLLFFAALIAFVPNLLNLHLVPLVPLAETPLPSELFDPSLAKNLKGVSQLERYIDYLQGKNGIKDTMLYAKTALQVVEKRFYHGYSHYSLKENWIAAVSGKLIWWDLSAIVIPDDILKYPMAACSQQSIVLMKVFEDKHIDYQKLGWNGHFTLQARIKGQWIYFDPDMEIGPLTASPLTNGGYFKSVYGKKFSEKFASRTIKKPSHGEVNEYPAKKARIFHVITGAISKWLWILPLAVAFILAKKRRNKINDEEEVIQSATALV